MMSVDKFIALYFPLKAKTIYTVKTSKWSSGFAFIIFVLFDAQFFFAVKANKGGGVDASNSVIILKYLKKTLCSKVK